MARPRIRRTLVGVLSALALMAPAAMVVSSPATADGNGRHRHDLNTYKREGWIAISGTAPDNTAHEHMLCDDGDYALDGMWKVDAHDGDDRTLQADASYGDIALPNKWHFRFVNNGPGRVQVKLFVTCLTGVTGERDGHTHSLSWRAAAPVDTDFTVAGGAVVPTQTCLANEIPVNPGFNFTLGGTGRIFRSYPTPDELGWQWAFIPTSDGRVTTYLHCLSRTTSSAGTPAHTHEVDADLLPGYGGQSELLGTGEQVDRTISSRAHDEGNIGAYWIDDPYHVWYLGQDARGQVRTTRFWFDGAGSGQVYLAVFGFDKRTTKYPTS